MIYIIFILFFYWTQKNYWGRTPHLYLQVTVYNAQVMEVFHSIKNLLNQLTGIFLCVEALLYDTVKEFPPRYPAQSKSFITTDQKLFRKNKIRNAANFMSLVVKKCQK